MSDRELKIVECPRDAMQGISAFIPTEEKIRYLNQLLKVGFETLDFGSFVSARAVPQMADTREVLKGLEDKGKTKLLAIVVNERGAEDALTFSEIDQLGYPMSISETFQQRNSKKSIIESLNELERIQRIVHQGGKELVVYVSMGFGNPYNDPFSIGHLNKFVGILSSMGPKVISIADTVGMAEPSLIKEALTDLTGEYPYVELGAHLHSAPGLLTQRIRAVLQSGITRLDGAIGGFGGCPFAADTLTGNLDTSVIISEGERAGFNISYSLPDFEEAKKLAQFLFERYH